MKKFNIACVIGTRPEALKMIPVIEQLYNCSEVDVKTIVTGQHRELLQQILKNSNIKINVNFDVMQANQSLSQLNANLLNHFECYLNEHNTDLFIAQGDTTTTLISALSAFYRKIPFAHVEAGLRTSCVNNPFPEEFNRRVTTLVSSLHFCPTKQAAENLKKEGITEHVYITGNTIIDTLYKYVQPSIATPHSKKIILVTCHRRENFGLPLANICRALKKIAKRNPTIEIVFPVHPNPNVKLYVHHHLSQVENILLIDPLDYPELVNLMNISYLVLTDSGGLQEEAPALKKPILVLRNETERPEGMKIGISRLVGHDVDTIIHSVEELISDANLYYKMSNAGSPYGDGNAALRIVKVIKYFLLNKQEFSRKDSLNHNLADKNNQHTYQKELSLLSYN